MITNKRPPSGKRRIDLRGPEGNAFALMGITKDILEHLGKDPKPILDKMMEGDYEKLLQVMEKEVGDFVIMHR